MYEKLILIGMIFLHIVDDFYLQGILARYKQREWWVNNYPDKLYRNDYIISLFIHSFSWSVSIMVLPELYKIFYIKDMNYNIEIVCIFILNIIVHATVDNIKANYKVINLVQDQLIHLSQIILTWLIYFY